MQNYFAASSAALVQSKIFFADAPSALLVDHKAESNLNCIKLRFHPSGVSLQIIFAKVQGMAEKEMVNSCRYISHGLIIYILTIATENMKVGTNHGI